MAATGDGSTLRTWVAARPDTPMSRLHSSLQKPLQCHQGTATFPYSPPPSDWPLTDLKVAPIQLVVDTTPRANGRGVAYLANPSKCYLQNACLGYVGIYTIGSVPLPLPSGASLASVLPSFAPHKAGTQVALKFMSKDSLARESSAEDPISELVIWQYMHRCNVQGISTLVDVLETTQLYIAVIELAKCDLNSYIVEYRKAKPFSERVGAAVIRCIANALHGMHVAKIAHRDFSVENVLVFERVCTSGRHCIRVVVHDFGVAQYTAVDSDGTPGCGSGEVQLRSNLAFGKPGYYAPEVYALTVNPLTHGSKHTAEYQGTAVDAWTLGVAMLDICIPGKPWQRPMPNERIDRNYYLCIAKGYLYAYCRQYWNFKISAKGEKFLRTLLSADPKKRASFADIVASDYLKAAGQGIATKATKASAATTAQTGSGTTGAAAGGAGGGAGAGSSTTATTTEVADWVCVSCGLIMPASAVEAHDC